MPCKIALVVDDRNAAPPEGADPGTSSAGPSPAEGSTQRPESASLDVLKALGDNTRYAIYLELARSALPRSTADVAEALGLHVNTVRPHLERMRDVGLLAVSTEATGGVGRPQHRYSLAPDAPSLGLEPSPWPTLATVLVRAAAESGLDPQDVGDAAAVEGATRARRAEAGRVGTPNGGAGEQGEQDGKVGHDAKGGGPRPGSSNGIDAAAAALDLLVAEQQRLGYDPEVVEEAGVVTVAFAHCPFRELAEADPQVVCAAHCGMVTGFVDELAVHSVTRFHSIVDRSPCQVELARAASAADTL